MLSPETRKLYYTPVTLPELKKSIEGICIHRANTKTNENQSVMEKRRLLITGGCGFIGSNFVNHWVRTYPDDFVINVDKLDTCSNIRNVEQPNAPNYKLVVASINNKDLMLHLMKQYDITHVVHFAGKIELLSLFSHSIVFFQHKLMSIHRLVTVSCLRNRISSVHIVCWKRVEFIISFVNLFTSAPMKSMVNGQQVNRDEGSTSFRIWSLMFRKLSWDRRLESNEPVRSDESGRWISR